MKRDRRLLIAILLFIIAFVAGLVQAWIVHLYVVAAVMGQAYWDQFVDFFGVDPIVGPNQVCFDYCAPELPFMAGWIAICAFWAGVAVVTIAWWKPRASGAT